MTSLTCKSQIQIKKKRKRNQTETGTILRTTEPEKPQKLKYILAHGQEADRNSADQEVLPLSG